MVCEERVLVLVLVVDASVVVTAGLAIDVAT